MVEEVTGVRMAEVSHQDSGAAGSNSGAGRGEKVDTPTRTRPKVLIPPVVTQMPADPPPEAGQQRGLPWAKRTARAEPEPKPAGSSVSADGSNSVIATSPVPPGSGSQGPKPTAGPASTAPQAKAVGSGAGVAEHSASPDAKNAAGPAAAKTLRAPTSRPGIARVHLIHVDPWSVMKQAFLLSLAIAIIILVASAALWFALDSAGVFEALTRTATDVGGEGGANVGDFLSFSKVMGVSLVLAGIETILVTALVTLFAFLYNLAVGIGGGLEITLSEED